MKKLINVFVLAMCLVIGLSVVGCGNNQTPEAEVSSSTADASSVEVSVTDSSVQATPSSSPTSSSVPTKSHYDSKPQYSVERESAPAASELAQTKVFLVGDSTVCSYSESGESQRFYMRNGYGMRLSEYLYSQAEIVNLALSGRSSKSFLTENNYATLQNSISEGDYLIIGFGHNDQKTGATLFTDPLGATTEPTSFKYHLYEYYIKLAIDKGATPILCTPIVRRKATGVYEANSSNVHFANGGNYAQAIIDLGAEKNVEVIDLTSLTKALLEGKTQEQSAIYFSWQLSNSTEFSPTSTSVDNTHINAYGAQVVAKMIAEELKKSDCSLKNYVLSTLPEPTLEALVPHAQ